MTPKRTLLALLSFVVFAAAANAADTITVGTVNATGSTVDVPVYIRDASGTPLGMDQPQPNQIQAFSIKVTYSPASSVQSITFTRAGITASLTPSFETSPASAGAISLLDTFQESTNPIPFTLNAALPGNQVAKLSITLASSAPPGSTISLTLDPTVTQLTDQGGTAATKETQANGNLSLVNGSVTIPNLTIALSPTLLTLAPNNNGTMSVIASSAVPSATTVTLASSNTAVATVPPNVTIASGATTANFTVNGVAVGGARITATLPASLGSGTASAQVNVAVPTVCNTPVAPVITAPTGAEVNAPYTISWSAVSDATEYFVDESTDAAFTAPTTTTVTTTSANFAHSTNNTTYYYRVRAHNHANTCDLVSPNSNVVSVLVGHPPATPMRVLPVVGSAPGAFGAYFKTSVQLYNPTTNNVSGKIVFHSTGSPDATLAYSLAPGKTLSYADLLPAMGVASGLGTADVVPDATSPHPIVLARVYNDAGVNGTTGLTEEPLDLTAALQPGTTAVLLAPIDPTKFRLNIGIRTLDQGVNMNIVVRDRDGNAVQTSGKSFGPRSFTQQGSAAITNYTLQGGESISFTINSGSAYIYGATTDNITNDPSVQFARPVE